MGLASKLQAAQAGGSGASSAQGGGVQPSAPPFPGGAPAGYPGGYGAPSQGQQSYGGPQSGSGQPPNQYGSGYPQQPPYGAPNQQQAGSMAGQQQQPPQQQSPYGAVNQQQSAYGMPGQQPPYGGAGQQSGPYGSAGQQSGPYGGQSPYGAPPQGAPGHNGQPGGFPGQYGGGQQPGGYGAPGSQPGARPGSFPSQAGGGRPGSYGGAPAGGGAYDANTIRNKLMQIIQANQLQSFYPPQALEQVVQRVASTDLSAFGARWRLPKEITLDVTALSLYDIVLFCDDSGSMAFEEGGERVHDLKEILSRTADAATLFDPDGIDVRFMNSHVEGNNLRSAAEVENLVGQVRFSGMTPLGTGLDRKVIQPLVVSRARANQLQKPVLAIIVTDGEPTGEPRDAVHAVIVGAKRYFESMQYGPGAVAFQFAQVGTDTAAEAFLSALDTDPVVGKHIDCVSNYELESETFRRKGIDLTPELWLVKLLVGAIDRTYDEQVRQLH